MPHPRRGWRRKIDLREANPSMTNEFRILGKWVVYRNRKGRFSGNFVTICQNNPDASSCPEMAVWENSNAFVACSDYSDVAGRCRVRQPIDKMDVLRFLPVLWMIMFKRPSIVSHDAVRAILQVTLVLAFPIAGEHAFGQSPLRPTSPPESLGEIIRSKPDTEILESSEPGPNQTSELRENEPTDSLRRPSEETLKPNQAAEDEDAARSRATLAHLIRLRKPIGQINLADSSSDQPKPENRKHGIVDDVPPQTVTALGFSTPIPDRYTICQFHRPLYFEQPNLERCGRGLGIFQNAVSGAMFLANTIMLPYRLGVHRPDCIVAAGGDCRACQTMPIGTDLTPINHRSVLYETLAIAAVSLLLL